MLGQPLRVLVGELVEQVRNAGLVKKSIAEELKSLVVGQLFEDERLGGMNESRAEQTRIAEVVGMLCLNLLSTIKLRSVCLSSLVRWELVCLSVVVPLEHSVVCASHELCHSANSILPLIWMPLPWLIMRHESCANHGFTDIRDGLLSEIMS